MARTSLRRGNQEDGNSDYFTGCPIGGGFMWYGLPNKIPSNCRICDNTTLAIASYAKLNENMGGAWGTDGTNINLPDLRGRFPRGVDGVAGNDPDKATRTAANTGGNIGNAVGSIQSDAMQGHIHNIRGNPAGLGDAGSIISATTYGVAGRGSGSYSDAPTRSDGTELISPPKTDTTNGLPRTTSETRVKNANVYFVIRVS